MIPKERATTALTLGIPDEVQTFELEFQLAEEFFGRPLENPKLLPENAKKMSRQEYLKEIYDTAIYTGECFNRLDYAIVPAHPYYIPTFDEKDNITEEAKLFFSTLRDATHNERLLACHADGTFAIPDGNDMYEFSYRIADEPEALKAEAQQMADRAIRRNANLHAAGIDVGLLCSDYCYNSGPFLSPAMFSEFIAPYLFQIIQAARADGMYAIKHTDGNIMPILDQLVQCGPHALHSLDPMAGVDIREVKRLVGDRVALCGNVHCAAMQTGTDQEVIDSAEYCLTYAKPGGGYFFCTSNVPCHGMPPQRYQLVLDVYHRMKKY